MKIWGGATVMLFFLPKEYIIYDKVRVLSHIKVQMVVIFKIARKILKFMISNA